LPINAPRRRRSGIRWVKAFAADRNPHGQKFYRVINEVPTGIVILVIVKPFS
jgi:putative membrane protein